MNSFPQMALFLMVALPGVGALLVLAVSRFGLAQVRRVAITNVLITFALSLVVVASYDPSAVDRTSGRPQLTQMETHIAWLGSVDKDGHFSGPGPDIQFALGVDGISLWLIALSALLMIPAVLVSWEAVQDRAASFYALMLLLESGLIGVFAAQDIILFYIFFEFTLIPLFFMVGIWGGHERRYAARRFFIYTLAGSVLTFLGLLAIVLSYSWMAPGQAVTFSIPTLTEGISQQVQTNPDAARYWAAVSPWIFLALFAGFAIKVPLFPFHTWLPLAHVEAPTAGSVLLAGVLLKIGSYGFLRFALPLVPAACWGHFHIVSVLAVIGIVYGALLALAQDDIKKLVAYSSVSHMGFCLLGLFALNGPGITGGLLQMVNHGLSTGALFAMVGMLYERYHTRDIEAYGGLARKFPILAFCLGIVAFSSIGLPGLNGFPGEVLSIMGMFASNKLYATIALTGIILGAWYTLWLVQRTFFGRLREPAVEGHGHDHPVVTDLNSREIAALAPILILIFWIGLYPEFFTSRMQPSIDKIVSKLARVRPAAVAVEQTSTVPVTGLNVGRNSPAVVANE
ncbi:MAG: NADH-quinone oxidoreductase subunit M [Planctomycetes bacterium]|nr:NADH-quinone oxidoreductase subunit M [Planctomycetota bacterium]